jgi:hypothetical protein
MAENFADHETQDKIHLKHNINVLREGSEFEKKGAITRLLEEFKAHPLETAPEFFQNVLENNLQNFLDSMDHKSDLIRETSIKILRHLLTRCSESEKFIPRVIEKLVERSNCSNLDSWDHLPPDARPTPSQLPHLMVATLEPIEEVRFLLLELLSDSLVGNELELVLDIMSDSVNILRVFLMDKNLNIQVRACEVLLEFILSYQEYLPNFAEILARALLLPLVSKKSKAKLAAMRALEELLFVGPFKQSYSVMDILIGYRDPNVVPIKDFYDPSHNVNYLALLINDEKKCVREQFLLILENWLINLKDREDHYPRLIPYLLTFAFDCDTEIQNAVVDTLEEIGKGIERDKGDRFREEKQLGVVPKWTWEGRLINKFSLFPFKGRVRPGVRFFIQTNMNKIVPAIKRELKDSINVENRLRSLKLLKYITYLGEEMILEHTTALLTSFYRNLKISKEAEIKLEIQACCELFGRFSTFDIGFKQLTTYIYESDPNDGSSQATFTLLRLYLQGYFEANPLEKGFGHKTDDLVKVVELLTDETITSSFGHSLPQEIISTYELVSNCLHNLQLEEKSKFDPITIFVIDNVTYAFDSYNSILHPTVNQRKLITAKISDQIQAEKFIKNCNERSKKMSPASIEFKILLFLFSQPVIAGSGLLSSLIVETVLSLMKPAGQVWAQSHSVIEYLVQTASQFQLSGDSLRPILEFFRLAFEFDRDHKPLPLEYIKKHMKNYLSLLGRLADFKMELDEQNKNEEKEEIVKINASIIAGLEKIMQSSNDKYLLEQFTEVCLGLCRIFTALALGSHNSTITFVKSLAERILILDETNEKFNQHLISVELMALKLFETADSSCSKDDLSDLLGTLMQVFWGISNADLKERVKNTMSKCATKQRNLIQKMIETAETDQRLQRLNLLNEISNFQK